MTLFQEALLAGRENTPANPENLFGQFVGVWDFQWIDNHGTPKERHVPGEWIFSWILEGNAVQDVFICPSRAERRRHPQPDGEYGTTVRFYNRETGLWTAVYGYEGEMTILDAQSDQDMIILTNRDYALGLNQWVFTDIKADTFHWMNRTSKDKGATWHINGELFAKRRKD